MYNVTLGGLLAPILQSPCAQRLLPTSTCDRAYDWKFYRHREVADNSATLVSFK
jgi:hypothetical protein